LRKYVFRALRVAMETDEKAFGRRCYGRFSDQNAAVNGSFY